MNSEKDEEMRHCYLDIHHKNKNEIIGIDKIRIKQMELSFLLADDKEYHFFSTVFFCCPFTFFFLFLR